MKKLLILFVAVAMACGFAQSASAISISLSAYNVGIGSFAYSVTGNQIDLYEKWENIGRGFVEISGLELGASYTVIKHIYNSTGVDWNLFSDELLDPAGNENDKLYDDPIAPWVPGGFSHSNNSDNLWYAYDVPKTSTAFASLLVDDQAGRDWLEFYDGLVSGAGGLEVQSFGLVNLYLENEPFLLAQRPNEHSVVPEPGTLMLLGSGLFSLGLLRRKK